MDLDELLNSKTFGMSFSENVMRTFMGYDPDEIESGESDDSDEPNNSVDEIDTFYQRIADKEMELLSSDTEGQSSSMYISDSQGRFVTVPIHESTRYGNRSSCELIATADMEENIERLYIDTDDIDNNFFCEWNIISMKPWCFDGTYYGSHNSIRIPTSVQNVSGFNHSELYGVNYFPYVDMDELRKATLKLFRTQPIYGDRPINLDHGSSLGSGYSYSYYDSDHTKGDVTYRYKYQETHAIIPVEYMRKFVDEHPDVEIWKNDDIEPSFQPEDYPLIWETAYKVSDILKSDILKINDEDCYWMPNLKAITKIPVSEVQAYVDKYPDFLHYNYIPIDMMKQQTVGKDIDGVDCYCVPIWEIPTIEFTVDKTVLSQFEADHPDEQYNGFDPVIIRSYLCSNNLYTVKVSSLNDVYPCPRSDYEYQRKNNIWSIRSYANYYSSNSSSSKYNSKDKATWDSYPRMLTRWGDKVYITYTKTGSSSSNFNSFPMTVQMERLAKNEDKLQLGQGHIKNAFNQASMQFFIADSTYLKDISTSFRGCERLQLVSLCFNGYKSYFDGSKLESISNGSFSNCTGLECVIIPPSVTSISSDCFNNCPDLKYIYYEGTATITLTGSPNAQILPYEFDEYDWIQTPVLSESYDDLEYDYDWNISNAKTKS